MTEEETYQSLGFNDEFDFFNLVANVDLNTHAKLAAFTAWKQNDGTKAGLLKLADQ